MTGFGLGETFLGVAITREGRGDVMTTEAAPQEVLAGVAQGDAPVLERVIAMNLDSFERSGLDESTYVLCRLAALVAMDGPPMSYFMHLAAASEAGVTPEQAQGLLIAIAPLVGSARVVAAAGNILRAFGFAAGSPVV
jgi:4-carboxymuconolactone decarboxylase